MAKKKDPRKWKPLPLPADMNNTTMDQVKYVPAKVEDIEKAMEQIIQDHEETLKKLAEE